VATPLRVTVRFNHVPAISGALRTELAREVGKSVFRLEGGIKARTHVISGFLRNSWRGTHAANSLTGDVSTNAHYAVIEQLTGSRYRPPHPGPQPAAAAEWPKLKAGAEDGIRRAGKAR
jgi:hypothetical protein